MMFLLEAGAPAEERGRVLAVAAGLGIRLSESEADGRLVMSVREGEPTAVAQFCETIKGWSAIRILESPCPYPRIARRGDVPAHEFFLMAGPCSVESEEQIEAAASLVSSAGAKWLRGGAFKPSTSPYGFQGFGLPALKWMRAAADRHGLKVVSEIMGPQSLVEGGDMLDMLQIGARNMQNFDLLRAVGRAGRPVLLKRGFGSRFTEWLLAAEHLADSGATEIVLCERGIRSFDSTARATLDLAAVVLAKQETRLPVIVDPSHAAGRRDLVIPLSMAAVAAGADGLLVEAHPEPNHALKDGRQSLTPDQLRELAGRLSARLAASS